MATDNDLPYCTCCGRPFRNLFDYPRVRIIAFERLPVPEAVDSLSDAAAEKWLTRQRAGLRRQSSSEGINLTPEIEQACRAQEVSCYLDRLAAMVGHEVEPAALLPSFPAHTRFQESYPIPETRLLLAIEEAEDSSSPRRTAEIQVLCAGPNLGSAGGPTLQFLGPISRITYEGLVFNT